MSIRLPLELEQLTGRKTDPVQLSLPLTLADGAVSTVHLAVFPRKAWQVRVAALPQAERILHWCKRNHVQHATSGGFFAREHQQPIGETWMDGLRIDSMPWGAHWADARGALHADGTNLRIAPLGEMPKEPCGDLITAGPSLLRDGKMLVHPDATFEGIPETWQGELDDDWTLWRAPRVAIGYDQQRIWVLVNDGPPTNKEWRDSLGIELEQDGLYLWEVAEILQALGATDALNLDGGGSATLVYDQRLINHPLSAKYDDEAPGKLLPEGRPLFSTLAFLPH